MKRLTLDVPRWHIYQHREARGLEQVESDDSNVRQFEDELFDRLFSGEVDALPDGKQHKKFGPWATQVHKVCGDLPSFERLAKQVRGDAAMAGMAVDQLMCDLAPLLKEQEDKAKEEKKSQQPAPQMDEAAIQKAANSLRRTVGSAVRQATKVVEELKEAEEALDQVGIGGWKPGSAPGEHARLDGERLRVLANELRTNRGMQKFVQLVGRFRRIAAAKLKQKVRHGVDEITDVTQGDDLARLLPTEIARLMHPLRKLAFKRDLYERSLLQYQMTGTEPKGKGPMIVCIDKSGSMSGEPDMWATAVAMALGDLALKQGRVFSMLAFDTGILHECVVRKGEVIPQEALQVDCNGGTDIDVAYDRAIQIIRENPGQLNKADIVMITDGGSYQGRTAQLREQAKELGVQSFGIAIGVPADCLKPWCDSVETVHDITTMNDDLATKLFAA